MHDTAPVPLAGFGTWFGTAAPGHGDIPPRIPILSPAGTHRRGLVDPGDVRRSIGAETTTRAPFARVRDAAIHRPDSLFADATADRAGSPPAPALAIALGAGASLRQEVTLDLGVVDEAEAELTLPVAWKPIGRRRLLPAFDGTLRAVRTLSGTRLWLTGTCAVPLGVVGRIFHRVVGRRAALRSVQALVTEIGLRLDSQTQRDPHEPSDVPEHPFLPEAEHSEIFIG